MGIRVSPSGAIGLLLLLVLMHRFVAADGYQVICVGYSTYAWFIDIRQCYPASNEEQSAQTGCKWCNKEMYGTLQNVEE